MVFSRAGSGLLLLISLGLLLQSVGGFDGIILRLQHRAGYVNTLLAFAAICVYLRETTGATDTQGGATGGRSKQVVIEPKRGSVQ